jgi:hypothetical protein
MWCAPPHGVGAATKSNFPLPETTTESPLQRRALLDDSLEQHDAEPVV